MKTLLQGGWVVAFNGEDHEVYDNGTVVDEDDRLIHWRRLAPPWGIVHTNTPRWP